MFLAAMLLLEEVPAGLSGSEAGMMSNVFTVEMETPWQWSCDALNRLMRL